MSAPAFGIEITSQGWITDDPEDARIDLCSHGALRLVIAGRTICGGDDDGWFTLSTSALALLRTLEFDHSRQAPVAEQLILHCGMLEMLSCPIGIDWSVTHGEGSVRLHDVVRIPDLGEEIRFGDLAVELSEDEYPRRIVEFAQAAKQPFAAADKEIDDNSELSMYQQFWEEYDGLLGRHRERP